MSKLWDLVLNGLVQSLFGGTAGSAVGNLAANLHNIPGKSFDLFVNSDVMGAAIGAILAIAGATIIESRRRKSAVKTAKALAKRTALELSAAITAYHQYMEDFLYSDANGNRQRGGTINKHEYHREARKMDGMLRRSAISFETAASIVLDEDAPAMIRLSHLGHTAKSAAIGLDQIITIEGPLSEIEAEVRKHAHTSWGERIHLIDELDDYVQVGAA